MSEMATLQELLRCASSGCASFHFFGPYSEAMGAHRWGAAGPPLEAYSRVTNPERFASLHDSAAALLHCLEREFDTERREAYALDPELEHDCDLSRPSVALLPCDVGAAPLIVAFSDFPGLRVRFGRWYVVAFPTCGCDACDETAESETERLRSLIENMTAGRFREAIRVRADGTAWKESEFWSTGGRRCPEELRLDQTRTRKLLDGGDRSSYEWGPWRRRP